VGVDPDPVLPDYQGASICNIVAAVRAAEPPSWFPAPAVADQVVVLVLDGLGWHQLQARRSVAPNLAAMTGGPITSVAPTTTATALTSITTGLPPAGHGILGYRMRAGDGEVLNVLRWRTGAGDAREAHPPSGYQHNPVFGGTAPPVVTRAEFAGTGFTLAHLPGVRLAGWHLASALPVTVARLLSAGETFVYAYYDGIDRAAHQYGFGPYYDAELRAADRLVADVVAGLPAGAALVVTADHGQVEVGDACLTLGEDVLGHTTMLSGEGRFRWLHAKPGEVTRLHDAALAHSDRAWVRTVDELEDEGWFGGRLSSAGRHRLGDVAVIARESVSFTDPADMGENALRCRHGSVTAAEMLVPLLAAVG
jgi:predicted AlkP superfamily pyrophosphatase or phosphodiesterase